MATLQITVNGKAQSVDVDARTLLVQLLRENLALTGTHIGCDTSQCGACTVLLNGQPVKSCSMLALQAQGGAITTVEGLAPAGGGLHPLQEAFMNCHGLQCGFCTPGMMMAAAGLLAKNPDPSADQIADALDGNLCRCTGYVNIVESVHQAAQVLQGKGVKA